jgi:hypothetical protein
MWYTALVSIFGQTVVEKIMRHIVERVTGADTNPPTEDLHGLERSQLKVD